MQARRTTALAAIAGLGASLMVATYSPTAVGGPAAKRADLVVVSTGTPPATVRQGAQFGIGATVANKGKAAAKPTTLRFYLSQDRVRGTDDILGATVRVKKVPAGKRKTVSGTVKVSSQAKGLYWVIACADAGKKVKEAKEGNNCRISKKQVDVDADLHADLKGTLTFLDEGTTTDPATGKTQTWKHTATANVTIAIDGDPADPRLVFNSTGSTYQRDGSVVVHQEDTDCTFHSERISKAPASSPLNYTGNPLNDDLTGGFSKTDLSEVHLGLFMRAAWSQTETRTGKGDRPCEASTRTTTGNELDVSSIDFVETSMSSHEIRYKPSAWKADMNTTSPWDKIEGELVLTLR